MAANGNGKSTITVVIASVLAVIAIIGVALGPVYTKLGSVDELKRDLSAHMSLPAHPVMETKLSGEVKRLDDRINSNDSLTASTNRELNELQNKFASHESESRSKFTEVETQFDSMAQSLNIQFAESQRRNADLQNALHELGAKLPFAPTAPWYFPNISNRGEGKK